MAKLGIYIPTWNRPHLLTRLLATIEPQLTNNVQVFVSINKSDAVYKLPDWVQHRETRINIGADPNIITGPTLLDTDYIWVIGDDDQLQPDAIQLTLEAIDNKPGLIIHPSTNHPHNVPYGQTFPNYPQFCTELMNRGIGWTIAAHTLISCNTFHRTSYDPIIAIQKIDSRYGFHYGMLNNLFDQPVHVMPKPTMLYGSEASVYQQTPAQIAEHMNAYPKVIHDIFDWIHAKTGTEIPHSMYKHGFDVY